MSGSTSDRTAPSARRRAAAPAVFAAAVLAGCFGALRLASGPPRFDHAAHAKRDLGCTDCHEGAKTGVRAGMPPADFCANCHDPKSDKPAVAERVAAYTRTAGEAPLAPSYGEVKFSHVRHVGAKIDCTACHTGALTWAVATPGGPLTMQQCMDCHEKRGAPNACATCHSKIGKETPPPNHDKGWTLHHGIISRTADRSHPAERCDLCHARAACDACHAQEPPRDHTNPWRTATHGLAASMDRSRCLACHQADSCDRCHEVQPPRSHGPGFGAPADRHCVTCHLPVETMGCVACHKGTPSHATAPPKPPTVSAHRPTTPPEECLSCHRHISHPVTFENCNACHR
jgi:hypothetical protein